MQKKTENKMYIEYTLQEIKDNFTAAKCKEGPDVVSVTGKDGRTYYANTKEELHKYLAFMLFLMHERTYAYNDYKNATTAKAKAVKKEELELAMAKVEAFDAFLRRDFKKHD